MRSSNAVKKLQQQFFEHTLPALMTVSSKQYLPRRRSAQQSTTTAKERRGLDLWRGLPKSEF
jgi:hypothetical protein